MKGAQLDVSDPMGGTRVVPIEDDRFTIGRGHGNSLSLNSPEISRVHAEIVKEEERYILRDLGSRAGTFVNLRTVVEHTLTDGDQIRIGRRADLRFLLKDTSETATTATISGVGELHQTTTLLDGLRTVGRVKARNQVLASVIDDAITLSGAERGFIMLSNPAGALEFTLARGRGAAALTADTFQTSRKIPEQVFATGEPQFVTDLYDEMCTEAHQGTIQTGVRTVYCVKLIWYVEHPNNTADARPIGVLYLDSRERGSLNTRAIHKSLRRLAADTAGAIEDARDERPR